MCGINGIVYFDRQDVDSVRLKMMCDQMVHRGPDDEGMFREPGVGLSFRRLSIIDTEGAHQPIPNEDKTIWLICNGEIYNYLDLREKLKAKGHKFRTAGDAETVLHLYEEYGKECVDHLRGMFGFIIWDSKTQTFFAARDHFGIKPLYYAYDQEKLVCSSELKSLLLSGEYYPRLDFQSLAYYLSFQYVPDPRTMIAGVQKLPPAHRLLVKDKKVHVERYWRPEFNVIERPADQIREEIREVMKNSVKVHMQSDVPRGCFLSSGVDSTAIAALMRQQEPIKTFSVGFEGPNNETIYSKQTADELGTDHYQWVITEEDYFDAVPKCIWYQDDPVADPSAIALYLVSRLAAEHVKVVLSGEGADELFGGYRIYQEPLALGPFEWMPKPLKGALNQVTGAMPDFYGRNYLMRATTPLEERFIGNAKLFTEEVGEVLAKKEYQRHSNLQNAFQWAKQYYDQVKGLDDVTRMQYIDINLWMPGNILAKADKMTMANSLELRVPFLDREVFRVASTIPTKYKVGKDTTKRILREALQEIIPKHIINRPKLGFPVPLRDWLKGSRGEKCFEVISGSEVSQFIDINYAHQLLRQHQSGKADNARKLWSLYVVAQWYNYFIEDIKKTESKAGIKAGNKILVTV